MLEQAAAEGAGPTRIQRRRTAGWHMAAGDRAPIYVGRPSRWGNPYRVGERYTIASSDFHGDLTPALAVVGYRAWLRDRIALEPGFLAPLRGHDLACWCPLDEPCHADVLLELANA